MSTLMEEIDYTLHLLAEAMLVQRERLPHDLVAALERYEADDSGASPPAEDG